MRNADGCYLVVITTFDEHDSRLKSLDNPVLGKQWRDSVETAFSRIKSVMALETAQLLALWNLEDMPACDEGMELARVFLIRCGEAVDKLGQLTDTGEPNTMALRNGFIRAHKALTEHRETCPKCNEAGQEKE